MLLRSLLLAAVRTATLVIAAPAPQLTSPPGPTNPSPSISTKTGDLSLTGSLGLAPNSINSTGPTTLPPPLAAAQKTEIPTIPITITNNTVAALEAQPAAPTIPITIINNTVAIVTATATAAPSKRRRGLNLRKAFKGSRTGTATFPTGTGTPNFLSGGPNGKNSTAKPTSFPDSLSNGVGLGLPAAIDVTSTTTVSEAAPTAPTGLPGGILADVTEDGFEAAATSTLATSALPTTTLTTATQLTSTLPTSTLPTSVPTGRLKARNAVVFPYCGDSATSVASESEESSATSELL